MNQSDKWNFAIGTTSRVPHSGGLHYLIMDFDEVYPFSRANVMHTLSHVDNFIAQQTEHGWHVYTDFKMPFEKIIATLRFVKADRTWTDIGEERGYMFLADKSYLNFPWPVEHMVINKETNDIPK